MLNVVTPLGGLGGDRRRGSFWSSIEGWMREKRRLAPGRAHLVAVSFLPFLGIAYR